MDIYNMIDCVWVLIISSATLMLSALGYSVFLRENGTKSFNRAISACFLMMALQVVFFILLTCLRQSVTKSTMIDCAAGQELRIQIVKGQKVEVLEHSDTGYVEIRPEIGYRDTGAKLIEEEWRKTDVYLPRDNLNEGRKACKY